MKGTVKEYLEHAIALGMTKTEVAEDLGLQFKEVNEYVAEYGLVWPDPKRLHRATGTPKKATKVFYKGDYHFISDLARKYGEPNGIPLNVVQKRISMGWDVERAVTYPRKPRIRQYQQD